MLTNVCLQTRLSVPDRLDGMRKLVSNLDSVEADLANASSEYAVSDVSRALRIIKRCSLSLRGVVRIKSPVY